MSVYASLCDLLHRGFGVSGFNDIFVCSSAPLNSLGTLSVDVPKPCLAMML